MKSKPQKQNIKVAISSKEEKIADNSDSSMQDNVKCLIPNQAFSGMCGTVAVQ